MIIINKSLFESIFKHNLVNILIYFFIFVHINYLIFFILQLNNYNSFIIFKHSKCYFREIFKLYDGGINSR